MTIETTRAPMTGDEMIALSKKHTLFEWSAQSKVDPIPVARAKGIYFWTPEGKRFIDFNSQLMCVNIGHGDTRVVRAIQEQAEAFAYANPYMATEPRARLGRHVRVRVGERLRLLLDGAHDARVAVADIHAHQLTVEVDEALPLRRPEVDPLGARHRNRIHLRLRGPLEERVLLRQRDHLVAGHRRTRRFNGHLGASFGVACLSFITKTRRARRSRRAFSTGTSS